jgi:hypothetical protein
MSLVYVGNGAFDFLCQRPPVKAYPFGQWICGTIYGVFYGPILGVVKFRDAFIFYVYAYARLSLAEDFSAGVHGVFPFDIYSEMSGHLSRVIGQPLQGSGLGWWSDFVV